MTSVIDASSVVAYLLGEGVESERAEILGDAHAPGLLDVEATQALRGLVRGSKLDLVRADQARVELRELSIRRHPDVALLSRAWDLRDVCTTYDALYVALAEGLDATLVTRDERLAAAVTSIVDVQVAG